MSKKYRSSDFSDSPINGKEAARRLYGIRPKKQPKAVKKCPHGTIIRPGSFCIECNEEDRSERDNLYR